MLLSNKLDRDGKRNEAKRLMNIKLEAVADELKRLRTPSGDPMDAPQNTQSN